MIKERFFKLLLFLTVVSGFIIRFPLIAQSQITLTIEDGEGIAGSCDSLEVSLDNMSNKVRGVQLDVCDVDNHLVAIGCKPTDRNSGCSCVTNEHENGCVTAILFCGGNLINEGMGPIFTISYGIFWDAPLNDDENTPDVREDCRDIIPYNDKVTDEGGDPIGVPVTLESGMYCFLEVECSADADCDNGAFCDGEELCLGGACQNASSPCPPDSLCDEDLDMCLARCDLDSDCDDGLYCNGMETCVSEFCQPGTNPCPDETECNNCNETDDNCYDPYGTTCTNDGLFCNGDEICDGSGNCVSLGNPCPPNSICNEQDNVCNCSQDVDCDDGLYCNGEEPCVGGACNMGGGDYPCTNAVPPADYQDCDEGTDTCVPSKIIVRDGSGLPGSIANPVDVSLENQSIRVRILSMDICDDGDYLTCTGCEITDRIPSSFFCIAGEQADGCCGVSLWEFGGSMIDKGTGPIFTVNYDVSNEAPIRECRGLNPQNVLVASESFHPAIPDPELAVDSFSGEFCFSAVCNVDSDCADGLYCNGVETCGVDSFCQPGTNPCDPETECNTCQEDTDSCFDPVSTSCSYDGNNCTDDVCDGSGTCIHPALPDGTSCDDGDDCTYTDTCSSGICSGTAYSCDDSNVCTDDTCNGDGTCSYVDNSNPCNDGDDCTHTDTCSSGICSGAAYSCDDSNVCTDDTCNGDGTCSYVDNSSPCNDGDDCTHTDTCSSGICSGAAYSCDDSNVCTDDTCNGDGACSYVDNSSPCNDGDDCTHTDTCSSGICSGAAYNCDDSNVCTDDTCNGDGACSYVDNSNPCNDGDDCTHTDTCSSGICSGAAYSCDDSNVCTDDTCNGDGTCLYVDNSNPCDDELFCTLTDECTGGVCVGSGDPCLPLPCDEDADECGVAGASDSDADGIPDAGTPVAGIHSVTAIYKTPCAGGEEENCDDNCPETPNGPLLGTCVKEIGGVLTGTGITCTIGGDECELDEICQMQQEDFNGNGIGDVCECYTDYNDDTFIDGGDLNILKIDYGRYDCHENPCQADGNDDGFIDGGDLNLLKNEYGIFDCPVIP